MGTSSGHRTAVALPSVRPRAPGKPMLVVIAGPELGRQIDLESGEVDIGRGEEVTLRIDSELVSRRHAAIQRFAGRFVIADLGSTNGTFVNERKIKTHTLSDGDQIRVGKVVLKYTECEIEAQYHEQILQMANVDAMTGCFNKRYFQETLFKLVGACRAANRSLSLVIVDIDHFKRINDTHGHAAGDAVLKQFASVVKSRIRETDSFCRVGGEEFTIVLDGLPASAARRAAELVRVAIEGAEFAFEGRRIPVTASLGVGELEIVDGSAEAFYKRVDARLYEAKRGGRNRVC